MVAEFRVEAELTDDELGVRESWVSAVPGSFVAGCTELSMHSFGLIGRPGVAVGVRSGS